MSLVANSVCGNEDNHNRTYGLSMIRMVILMARYYSNEFYCNKNIVNSYLPRFCESSGLFSFILLGK